MDHKVTRREVIAASVALGAVRPACPQQMIREQIYTDLRNAKRFVPTEGPNKPMGVGKGIHPGRVVWVHNPEVAKWDGVTEARAVTSGTGEWWEDSNCDPVIAARMVTTALQGLTGQKSDKEGWKALFHHFNRTKGFGDAGYKPGEKIAIKFNFNNDRPEKENQPWPSGKGMPSPQIVHAVVKQLVESAGIPGRDITIYDVADGRYISDPVYERIRAEKNREYQDITFMVNPRTAGLGHGRIPAVPDMTCPLKFSDPTVGTAYVPVPVTKAKYRINCALFRPHDRAGVTLTAKNNFGSIYWVDGGKRETQSDSNRKDYWGPRPVHQFVSKTHAMGTYNAFVDLIGFKHLGQKDVLYIVDGLYGAFECEANVMRYQSFNDHWTSSLFMSQDPIAIDSVGLDFIRNEPKATPCGGLPDNFMHEAALADNPPSGVKYDPEQNGTRLASLGVHEHWNNAEEKKYSRNLGKNEGIELVSLKA